MSLFGQEVVHILYMANLREEEGVEGLPGLLHIFLFLAANPSSQLRQRKVKGHFSIYTYIYSKGVFCAHFVQCTPKTVQTVEKTSHVLSHLNLDIRTKVQPNIHAEGPSIQAVVYWGATKLRYVEVIGINSRENLVQIKFRLKIVCK